MTKEIASKPGRIQAGKYVACVLLGALVGAVIMGWSARQARELEMQKLDRAVKAELDGLTLRLLAGPVNDSLGVLVGLRAGRVGQTITNLEERLTYDIRDLVAAYPVEQLSDTNAFGTLMRAARYRNKWGFKTGDTNVDEEVNAVLLNVMGRNAN